MNILKNYYSIVQKFLRITKAIIFKYFNDVTNCNQKLSPDIDNEFSVMQQKYRKTMSIKTGA